MIEISLNNIEKNFGIENILKDLNLQINKGEKIGIVGENGSGKTTIFKIITGLESLDKGRIFISKNSKIGYLEQVPNYSSDRTARDILNLAFKEEHEKREELRILENKMKDLQGEELEKILKIYGKLQEEFELIGGYDIEEKLSKITVGLGINENIINSKFNTLSGGEKTTVLLGKILLESPDILLLDEPTNHLDMESIDWLENYISNYNGTVITISHDRYFLDRVVSKIVEISNKKANIFFGNYTYYLKEKERLFEEELKKFENQQKEIKSMEESIKRMKEWAARGDNENMFRRAFSMEKRLNKMEVLDKPLKESNMKLNFEIKGRSGNEVLNIKDVSKSYGKKILFQDLNMNIKFKDKVSIIGKNGTGKTTIIKMILGKEKQDKGEIKIGSNVKIGYLEQNITFKDENKNILDTFRYDFLFSEEEARGILAKFLFFGEDVFKRVKDLSGGERARLRLCQLMHKEINTLILDEPTNHLDILSREMLEETLMEFKGTLIFISHDRYFINKLANTIYELSDKRFNKFLGNYDYYIEKKTEEKTREENIEIKEKKALLKNNRNIKKKKNPIKIKLIEDEISILDEKIEKIEEEMEIFAADFVKLNELLKEKGTIEEKLSELMEEWMKLNE
ncbi:MAG: ABC-F type ribosomal protection protein [Miniphocaeibacter sp.]|uniref:ribosomal protection-like ABC-F family protein n=1 Tax=Miniphocaeibacter sp. TaxID=3100973 RepID=UPI0017B6AAD7|nr:ABC-F type ribosomal protection protein [Gallicola sp.]